MGTEGPATLGLYYCLQLVPLSITVVSPVEAKTLKGVGRCWGGGGGGGGGGQRVKGPGGMSGH